MRVFINDIEITLVEGMTVKHALTAWAAGVSADYSNWIVCDRWGNRLGLDGTLLNGDSITVEIVPCRKNA